MMKVAMLSGQHSRFFLFHYVHIFHSEKQVKPSPCNLFFLMENAINGRCSYLCRILYFIDILQMRSSTSRRKALQYMARNFKHLPTDMYQTLKPTTCPRKTFVCLQLTYHLLNSVLILSLALLSLFSHGKEESSRFQMQRFSNKKEKTLRAQARSLPTSYILHPIILGTIVSCTDRYNSPYNLCAFQISVH